MCHLFSSIHILSTSTLAAMYLLPSCHNLLFSFTIFHSFIYINAFLFQFFHVSAVKKNKFCEAFKEEVLQSDKFVRKYTGFYKKKKITVRHIWDDSMINQNRANEVDLKEVLNLMNTL